MAEKVETKHNIQLTSAELGALWTQYLNDTMATCVLKYFLNKVEDSEIKPVVEDALSLAEKHTKTISDIFTHEKHPIPIGFTKDDVNVDAPRLFSDGLILMYIRNMAMAGMGAAAAAIGVSARSDVSDFFMEIIASVTETHNKSRKVLLSKGLYVRHPFISIPEKVDFVKKQGFLTGFFGERRPLIATEITHLFNNVHTNAMGKGMCLGFAQTAKTQEIKDYMVRGMKIAQKHMEILQSILAESDLPAPVSWDQHVMDSTVPPFSEKLMMFHTTALSALGMGNYGLAMSVSVRRDLSAHYQRLIQEILQYSEDGANIMIDYGWMEEQPQADDRKELIKGKADRS
ncbi:DUF3231 family protein [Ammoniphilus sp. 3BR4]|uniref:DUF3231 family protein n=1 Tax=Ammoniphilus sp. 3BR4 TaxID=3158265 RepID=UPI00346621A0